MTHQKTPRVPPQYTWTADCAFPLEVQAVVCPGLGVAVAARLRYHPTEPYTVYLDNHIDLDDPITWAFARELLATGVNEWAGMGDVSVFPGAGEDPETLFISLLGDRGEVVLRARASHVRRFLAWTERLVPFGEEGRHLDLDGVLKQLQGEGPPSPRP